MGSVWDIDHKSSRFFEGVLLSRTLAGRADEFFVTTARVAGFAVHFAGSTANGTIDGFTRAACATGHRI